MNDVEIQQVEKKFTHVNLVDVGGSVGAQVSMSRPPVSFDSRSAHIGHLPRRTGHVLRYAAGGHVPRQAS